MSTERHQRLERIKDLVMEGHEIGEFSVREARELLSLLVTMDVSPSQVADRERYGFVR